MKRQRKATRPFLRMWLLTFLSERRSWDGAAWNQSLSVHTEAGKFPLDYSRFRLGLFLQVWKSFASSLLHKVDELIGREPVLLALRALKGSL